MNNGISIDTTDDTVEDRVDLSSLSVTPKKPKKVITHELDLSKTNAVPIKSSKPTGAHGTPVHHKEAAATPVQQTPARSVVSIDAVAQPEPEDPDREVHVSPIDDMLNPENPNSVFAQYVEKKDKEASEWIAEYQETKALEAESEAEEDKTDEKVAAFKAREVKYQMDDDLDLSSLEDEPKKETKGEEKAMSENNEIEIDAGVDKTELPEMEPIVEEETVEEEAVEETVDEEDSSDDEEYISDEESTSAVIGVVPGMDEKEEEEKPVYANDIEMADDMSSKFEEVIVEEEEEVESTNATPNDNEVLKNLQKLATERLKPVSAKLDISSVTILKKPVMNINSIYEESTARVVKWVLPAQESIVLMKEFSGSELEKLREYSENTRSVDSLNRRYRIIYDHIASPKPATFEQWLKSTPLEDIDHYFFAIYIASFKGANYLPMDCPNPECKETFITEDINIMDMVKFDNDEMKKKFTTIYQSEASPAGKGIYCTELVPLTENIAIGFKQPSVYNIIEIATMSDKARSAYSTIIDYIPFIDNIYIRTEGGFAPVGYKIFADNSAKTFEAKLKKYEQVFNALSVDSFGPIKAYVRALSEKTTGMRYVYPAIECPKCHKETTEQNATAEELVFTRYQLGSLVTTSLS